MGATWNIDKLTLTYVDSEKTADEQQSYQKVHMENRWKSQRITEQNGSIAYALADKISVFCLRFSVV